MSATSTEFLSTREAARLLGVALRTVQLWVEAGVLRAWKTAGGHRRITRESVDALLRERQVAIGQLPAEQAGTEPAPASRYRLLIVEDEPALLKLYTLQIAGWNLPVELMTANNGFEGLILIGERRPDLLVTDLNMPGMDGFRMIRHLRANPDYRDLQIVVVTALGKQDIADRGGLPADVRVFTKPIPFSELERIVRGNLHAASGAAVEAAPRSKTATRGRPKATVAR